jgi:putative toxin-antitoxin system antitoxin component (TIGR02293 family)
MGQYVLTALVVAGPIFAIPLLVRFARRRRERHARIARAWAAALDTYRDRAIARTFLQRPHQLLRGRTPIAVAAEDESGAQAVEGILGRLRYGSAA